MPFSYKAYVASKGSIQYLIAHNEFNDGKCTQQTPSHFVIIKYHRPGNQLFRPKIYCQKPKYCAIQLALRVEKSIVFNWNKKQQFVLHFNKAPCEICKKARSIFSEGIHKFIIPVKKKL